MRTIPPKLRAEMEADPYYKTCVHQSEDCRGRIEWDHVFIYAGRQVNEKWAILPTCHWHHVNIVRFRRESERIAVKRATLAQLAEYPKRNWSRYL